MTFELVAFEKLMFSHPACVRAEVYVQPAFGEAVFSLSTRPTLSQTPAGSSVTTLGLV